MSRAEWGNWYYSTGNVDGMSFQSGSDRHIRQTFIDKGKLENKNDKKFRRIHDDWPCFGFAVDLGAVTNDMREILFTIGLAQDKAIQFLGKNGLVEVPSLWKSYWPKETDAVCFTPTHYFEH